jgi:hypothetical protein
LDDLDEVVGQAWLHEVNDSLGRKKTVMMTYPLHLAQQEAEVREDEELVCVQLIQLKI